MLKFPAHKICTDCSLHETATNPGLPTRCHSYNSKETALLIVGEAPGFNEDAEFKSWVGRAGTILSKFIAAVNFQEYADVYLSNACRCRPPQNADPTAGQINACRKHLQFDLDTLRQNYKSVVIFCVGRYGSQTVTRQQTLSSCFSLQGNTLEYFNAGRSEKTKALTVDWDKRCDKKVRVFFSYHPAALIYDGSRTMAVQDHFILLRRYLAGEFIPNSIQVVPELGVDVPCRLPSRVYLDIETYGILKGVNQSVFHPLKSQVVDGVPIGQQIVSVSLGYADSTAPTGYRTFSYIFRDRRHRRILRSWFKKLSECRNSTTLIGQNLKFDLLYLMMNDSVLSYWIQPSKLTLDDLMFATFLFYEQRPEMGLKELATLFGLTDYSRLTVTGKSGTAKSPKDPALHLYNCLDVATTAGLYEFTWSEIRQTYGDKSYKLTPQCAELRNQILWDTITLETNGCAMNIRKLTKLHKECQDKCTKAITAAKEEDVIIAGVGSEASGRKFIHDALEDAGMLTNPQVKLTEKKKEISVGKDNFNLLSNHLNPKSQYWNVFQTIQTYHKNSKILTSYTSKLLNKSTKRKGEGIVKPVGSQGIVYPSWYPIPSPTNHYGDTNEAGGTIQGRFSARKPGAQTFPPPVMSSVSSRYIGGKIIGYDLSQIELRMGALLSGDPVMMGEYHRGIDRHTQTALFLYPNADIHSEEFRRFPDGQRQAGKRMNFLVLYRGGALKYQETMMKEHKLLIPLDKCKEGIAQFSQRYRIFRLWQDQNIDKVRETGHLELVTGWSRHWGKGHAMSECVSEICDFPIQTIAAQLLQSAQFAIQCEMQKLHLKSLIVLQIHDALYLDVFPGEEKIIDKIMKKFLTRPPILDYIEHELKRSVPIEYEKEIK